MATLYGIDCDFLGGNTGTQACDMELGRIIGTIGRRRNTGYNLATTTPDNIYSLLAASAVANTPALRVYPIFPGFEVTATNGEDRTQATAAGSGNTKTLRDAKKGWTWTSWAGLCYYSAIEQFNGSQNAFDYYLVTDKNQLIGIRRNGQLQGLRFSEFYVSPYDERMDDTAPQFTISVRIEDTEEWRKKLVVIVPSTDNEYTDIQGLLDAQPNNYHNASPLAVAGTIKIGVTAGCGGGDGSTNLVELYETVLEDTDNWTVRNAKTKAAITVTSITADASLSYLTFVMPTTSPYVPGDGIEFVLGDHDTLDAADMPGYEGKSVIVPNPAA